MSKDIKVKLYSNSSQFNGEMKAIAVQMKNIKSEFEKNRTAVGVWGNELKTSQTKVRTLSQQLDQHKMKVKALERAYADSAIKKGKDARETQNLARRLNYATAEMNKTQNALTQTTNKIQRMEAEIKRTSSSLYKMGQRMSTVGNKMRSTGASVAMTTGVAFAGLALPLKDAVEVGMDFEKQMSKVQAISGGTAQEIKKLEKQAMDLGATTVFTASQAADAQSFLAMAGFKANDIYAAMPGMLNLAAAGQLDLAAAADISSNMMQAFAMKAEEAGHASDVIAYGAANANTNVEQMGEAMKFLAPNANSLGWGLEESAAAVMAFGDAGLQGSIAGQAFGTSLIRLATPAKKAQKVIDNLGFAFFDAAGDMKSMPEVVAEMEKGMKGMTKEQQAATLKTIVGAESYKHWAILLQKGSKALKENTKALKESDGAAQDMADTMLDNARGSIIAFNSAVEGAKIKLSKSLLPALGDLAEKGADIVNMFNKMDSATAQTVAKTALFATGVLGATTAVATLTMGIGALLAFTGPVGLAIVGGTALLGGIAVATYAYNEQLKNQKKQQEEAKESALLYGEGVSKATQKAAASYVSLREKATSQLFQLTQVSGEEADKMANRLLKTYQKMSTSLVKELEGFKTDAMAVLNGLFEDQEGKMKEKGEEWSDQLVGKIDQDVQTVRKKMKQFEKLKEETGLITSNMNEVQRRTFNEIITFFQQSTSKFAANQKDALAIQQRVSESQNKLSFKNAKGYNDQITELYKEGQKAAKKDRDYMSQVMDEALAKEAINAEQHKALKAKINADYQKSLAQNLNTYKKSSEALFDQMSKDGQLLDLETGKALERQKEYSSNSMGIFVEIEESETAYQARWAEKQVAFLQKLGDSKEEALKQTRKSLVEFNEGLGLASDEAASEADKTIAKVEKKMNRETSARNSGKKIGNEFADGLIDATPNTLASGSILKQSLDLKLREENGIPRIAGQEKGQSFSEGINSSKVNVSNSGSVLQQALRQKLSEGNAGAKTFGSQKGQSFSVGISSTKGSTSTAASSVNQTALSNLNKNTTQATQAGATKGKSHSAGITSTKGANTSAASSVSATATAQLAKTTDGGGGQKAGTQFASGIRSQAGNASNSGSTVAQSGKQGLSSVKTTGTGADFSKGFANGIRSMGGTGGTIWKAAWAIGKVAIRSLKDSIQSKSPAKKTIAEGVNFGDGFIIGLGEKAQDVKKSTAAMAQGAMASFKSEINRMAFNIQGAADEINTMRAELTVKNEIDTPVLNQKLDALISLLSNNLQTNNESVSAAGQTIKIHPAPVIIGGEHLADIVFNQGDTSILDKKSAQKYEQNAYKGGLKR
ncbi:phage tail tape measure protein [Bacillus pumilus]|uniref:phage tail tape measure protein n=1 Tax=Bacillus pumilus TaxID=1408 RepID=UPI0031F52926